MVAHRVLRENLVVFLRTLHRVTLVEGGGAFWVEFIFSGPRTPQRHFEGESPLGDWEVRWVGPARLNQPIPQ